MMTTIAWELRQRRTAIIWWAVGSLVLTLMILALYPVIKHQAQGFNAAINQLPSGIRQLKSGGAANINVADPTAFLSSQLLYITLPMVWMILAIGRGHSLLGKDEQAHTIELLLSRPVSRTRLLLAKFGALLAEFAIVTGISVAALILLAPAFQLHMATSRLLLAGVGTSLFSLSFGIFTYGLTAVGGVVRSAAVSLAVILSFGSYLLASLSGLASWLKDAARFAPYHYFVPADLLDGKSASGLWWYLLGTLVVCGLIGYFGFRRRDID